MTQAFRALSSIAVAVGASAGFLAAGQEAPAPQKPTATQQIVRDAGPNTQPAPGTGLIAGALLAQDSGRPVRRARVSLSGSGDSRIARTVTTDEQGTFSFASLPAGPFVISASKPGFLDIIYGQKRPGSGRTGTPIQLMAGQHLDHLDLQLPRGGVITGTILDEQGEPAFGTTVRALRDVMRTGEHSLQAAGSAQSDDRGVYRISGLLPGEYIVTAIPREADMPQIEAKMAMEDLSNAKMRAASAAGADPTPAQDIQKLVDQIASAGARARDATSGYAPVYYPGTTAGQNASKITLDVSEEKPGIDLQLQIVPLSTVTGVVTSPDGQLPSGTQVMLLDNGRGLPGSTPRTTRPGADGSFTFTEVPQGQYTLLAQASSAAAKLVMTPAMLAEGVASAKAAMAVQQAAPMNQYWAMADVTADARGGSPATLSLQPGMSLTGQVVFEGAAAPTDLTRARMSLTPIGQGTATALAGAIRPVGLDADARFTLVGLVPGRYRLTMPSTPPGWSVKSSFVSGQDTLDVPFDAKPNENVSGAVVTLSTRATELSGMLQSLGGEPRADFTVIVFASDVRFWAPQSRRVQGTRPATDGRFSFQGLPPGEYRMAAVSDVEPGQWFDPAFLRQLVAASMIVTLGEGERKTQDLRVAAKSF